MSFRIDEIRDHGSQMSQMVVHYPEIIPFQYPPGKFLKPPRVNRLDEFNEFFIRAAGQSYVASF